jgi:ribosomal protein S18 acetylase RimI-like enzyme
MVKLRPAQPDDGPSLNRICYPHYAPDEMEQALLASLRQAKTERGIRLVAEQDGQIVGSGQLSSWAQGAEIADLIVIPSHRGQGIGQALIEALLEKARALGLPAVEIGVQAGNQRALALYQRLGFTYRRTAYLTLNGNQSAFVYLEQKSLGAGGK